jgi:hypothetical protein
MNQVQGGLLHLRAVRTLGVGEHVRIECYPHPSVPVEFVTHPATDVDDRFGSKTGEKRSPGTLRRPVVTFAKGDDPGDRLPVAGHDNAAALAHTAEKTRKAAVGIGCGDGVIHNLVLM